MLETLWIDLPGARDSVADRVEPALQSHVAEFIDKGYTIFRGAVPGVLVDKVIEDTLAIHRNPERYVLKNAALSKNIYVDPTEITELRNADRISDIYGLSQAARNAIFVPPVRDFLFSIFGAPAIATQSISFEYGSQQAIHQDTAYVVVKEPLSLAAAWIALQDVEAGTGELIFYPGSHRFDHFFFSGQHKHFLAARDGADRHNEFLAQLHAQAKQRGFELQRFLPKTGDVLVWHADLAHGGARITSPGARRRSLVAHYSPITAKPNYMDRLGPTYHEYRHDDRGYFASSHYNMRDLEAADHARILFDGNVTAKRQQARAHLS